MKDKQSSDSDTNTPPPPLKPFFLSIIKTYPHLLFMQRKAQDFF